MWISDFADTNRFAIFIDLKFILSKTGYMKLQLNFVLTATW